MDVISLIPSQNPNDIKFVNIWDSKIVNFYLCE